MKKALFLTLVLVMCLSLIPVTALAYGNERIQLEKDNFDPNEKMVITIKGVTQQMVDDMACVGIFKKDLSVNAIDAFGELRQVGDNVFDWFEAPTEPGEYAVVLLSKWWQNGNFTDLLVTSVSFTVGKIAKEGHISLDKTAYTAMNPITVSFSGITEQMVNAKAFLRIEEKGVLHGSAATVSQGSGTVIVNAPNKNGEFVMCLYSVDDGNWNATAEYLVMSVPFTVSGATGSTWAQGELEKANEMGLIPDCLRGADLTKPITRAEFAALSVKLFENLSGQKAVAAATNPFTDTNDVEVLKAYNTGLMVGISADKFDPNTLLNREQAATALTRVLKRTYIPGWTFATDGNYTLNFTMPAKFADDAKISSWAYESVYFMVANQIINGKGNNIFDPKDVTPAEVAIGASNATREQALAIAVRMVENLKDKPLDYK